MPMLRIYRETGTFDLFLLANDETVGVLREGTRLLAFLVFAVKLPLLGIHA